MAQSSRVRPYRWLAQYYDDLFSSSRTPIDAMRQHVLGPILPHVRTACDLACGTGSTALRLARAGIDVYAVDLSPVMCRIAREKAKIAGLPVRVVRSDMRTFRLRESVDLITCEADALNHLPRRADLLKVLKAMARALRPGGYVFFDVNNSIGFERYWSGVTWLETPGVVAVIRNGHTCRADKAWSDVEWFIQDGTHWRRHHERVEEICWSSDEIRCALRDGGFERVRTWDAAPFFNNPLISPGCHTAYLAQKSHT